MSRLTRQIPALLLCLLLATSADLALGQRGGDRGGFPGGGGPPGGGGFPGGGFPGGGFPGGGGPPGGGSSDFIRRFDTNGNGMLDPDESQGRAKMFLDRILGSIPGIDLSKPVPIDKLSQGFDRAREQRGSQSSAPSTGGSSAGKVEPLVPGFGTDEVLALPPGFGAEGALYTVKVTAPDNAEADERFRRYDTNKDGFLDRAEIERGRWSDDPFAFDRNHDGKLSPSEMAVRYAQRRVAREGSASTTRTASTTRSSSSPSTASRTSSSTTPSSSSGGTESRMAGMIDGMMSRYDSNRDGVLSAEEASGSRMLSGADANGDGKVTKDELNASFASRFGGGGDSGRSFGGRGGGDSGDRGRGGPPGGGGPGGDRGGFFSRRESSEAPAAGTATSTKNERLSYRFKTAAERLPEGLPPWFSQNDGNADGQVAMAEFSVSWSDRTLADFRQFDLNLDGIVTADECLQASSNGAVRGTVASTSSYASRSRTPSSTSPSSSSPSTTSPLPTATSPTATSTAASSPAATTTTSTDGGGIDPRYLDFSRKTLGRYDLNGNGSLEKDEWSKMSSSPEAADKDGDGKISVEELAVFYTKK